MNIDNIKKDFPITNVSPEEKFTYVLNPSSTFLAIRSTYIGDTIITDKKGLEEFINELTEQYRKMKDIEE